MADRDQSIAQEKTLRWDKRSTMEIMELRAGPAPSFSPPKCEKTLQRVSAQAAVRQRLWVLQNMTTSRSKRVEAPLLTCGPKRLRYMPLKTRCVWRRSGIAWEFDRNRTKHSEKPEKRYSKTAIHAAPTQDNTRSCFSVIAPSVGASGPPRSDRIHTHLE